MTVSKHPEPGERFGIYEIVRPLGAGGMGAVYEALHTALGKRVAIKLLHEHLAQNRVAAERFVREGRTAAAIRHPNVVQVFEVGLHFGTPYLVMELLEGLDLADHLRARGRLSGPEAVDIVLATCSAVSAAHAAGVIHRDLKPRNIFLAREGRAGVRPKLLDFGISKLPDEREHALTETGALLGTIEYMAAELARSAKSASQASDQYALGVILYECVTALRPFTGASTYELLHAIVTAPFATPRLMGVDIPPGLEAVILRAMSRDPTSRFPSVHAMGHTLLPFASDAARAWWQSEFARSPERYSSESAIALCAPINGSEASIGQHRVGTTVPEDGLVGRARLAFSRVTSRGSIVAACALAVATAGTFALLRIELAADTPRGDALVASRPDSEVKALAESEVFREPPAADRFTPLDKADPAGPLPAPTKRGVPHRLPASTRLPAGPAPASSAATVSSVASASSNARPSAVAPVSSMPPTVSLQNIERGYNGAPIVE